MFVGPPVLSPVMKTSCETTLISESLEHNLKKIKKELDVPKACLQDKIVSETQL